MRSIKLVSVVIFIAYKDLRVSYWVSCASYISTMRMDLLAFNVTIHMAGYGVVREKVLSIALNKLKHKEDA